MSEKNAARLSSKEVNRGIATKRPAGYSSRRNMRTSFQLSWSQRGHDVYMVFMRTTNLVNLKTIQVDITNETCVVESPGMERYRWNFFLEVVAKEAQRIDSSDRLVIVIPKKDPTLKWPSLKKSIETYRAASVSSNTDLIKNDEPPEKILYRLKEEPVVKPLVECSGKKLTAKRENTTIALEAATRALTELRQPDNSIAAPCEDPPVEEKPKKSDPDESGKSVVPGLSEKIAKNDAESPQPKRPRPGCIGLSNLFNSCFMNSVIQALANTADLLKCFFDKKFEEDLNVNSWKKPGSIIAREFSAVLRRLWTYDDVPSFEPTNLVELVRGEHKNFERDEQHDAQEFLGVLLNMLNNDLNRVKVKSLRAPKYEGDVDHLLAEESWKAHKAEKDSYIVDLFDGLFKSTLDCPKCDKHSTKFEVFSILSVPLPKAARSLNVLFSPKDPNEIPIQLHLNVSRNCGTAQEIFTQVAELMNCSETQLRLFEVFNNRIHRFFVPDSLLDQVYLTDILCLQETLSSSNCDGELVYEIAVIQRCNFVDIKNRCLLCDEVPKKEKIKRCKKCKSVVYCTEKCQKEDWRNHETMCDTKSDNFVGFPFIVSIPMSCSTYSKIKKLMNERARLSVSVDDVSDEGADQENITNKYMDFDVTPIHWFGSDTEDSIIDLGEQYIDLTDYKLVAIDWRVKVTTKRVRCEERKETIEKVQPNLYDCFKLFTEPEILARDNAWHCSTCNEPREATKQMLLWKLPDVLIVQLKRFSSFGGSLQEQKIDDFIDFPVRGLDMSKYCFNEREEKSQIYDLFAVVNHNGNTKRGHYTTYVRLPSLEDSTKDACGWRLCNDDNVHEVSSEKEVVTADAYLMFYQRRTCRKVEINKHSLEPGSDGAYKTHGSDTTDSGNSLDNNADLSAHMEELVFPDNPTSSGNSSALSFSSDQMNVSSMPTDACHPHISSCGSDELLLESDGDSRLENSSTKDSAEESTCQSMTQDDDSGNPPCSKMSCDEGEISYKSLSSTDMDVLD